MPTTPKPAAAVAFSVVDLNTGKVLAGGTAATEKAAGANAPAGAAIVLGVAGRPGVDFYDAKRKLVRAIPVPSLRARVDALEKQLAELQALVRSRPGAGP